MLFQVPIGQKLIDESQVISFIAIPYEGHQICMVHSQKKINLR